MNTPDTERVVKYVRAMLENELAEPRFIDTLTNYISQSFTSRDSYWKERVKTLKKADQIIIHKTLGGGYVCFNPSLVYPANTKIQPVFGKTPEDALSHHLQALDNLK